MTIRKIASYALPLMLIVLCLSMVHSVSAQGDNKATDRVDDTNLDTQLYLLVGTNSDVGEAKIPAVLEPVVRQLRASLPFKNYRLSTTLINRVKSDGRLSLSWAGGPLIASAAAAAATSQTPGFNEFNVHLVRILDDNTGQKIIRMEGFKFGARIPIVTYSGVAAAGSAPVPAISYENTGLNTDISMREGEPVVVGTLNVGPSGDAIILVISAKRTSR